MPINPDEVIWDDEPVVEQGVQWDTSPQIDESAVVWDDDDDRDFFSQETFTRFGAALDKSVADTVAGIAGVFERTMQGPAGEAKRPAWINEAREWSKQFKGPQGESTGRIEDAVVGLASFGGPMIAQAIAWPLGTAATFAALYGQKEMELLEKGKDPQVAADAALLHASTSSPAELAGNLLQIKALKNVFGAMGSKAKIGPRFKKILGNFLASGLGEAGEERIQGHTEAFVDIYAEHPNASFEELMSKYNEYKETPEFKEQIREATIVGGIGGLLLPGAGAVIGAPGNVSSYFDQKREEIYKKMSLTEEERKEMDKEPSGDLDARFEDREETPADADIVTDEEAFKSGLTPEQQEQQKEAQRLETEAFQAEQERRRKMEIDWRQEMAEKKAEQERLIKEQQDKLAADQEAAEQFQDKKFMDAISTPEGVMNSTSRILSNMEKEGAKQPSAKPIRTAHQALATGADNLDRLAEVQYKLREVHLNTEDKHEKELTGALDHMLTTRIEQVKQAELEEEQAKLREQEAKKTETKQTQAKAKEAQPAVAKARIQAEKTEAKKKQVTLAAKVKTDKAARLKKQKEKLTQMGTRAEVKATYTQALERGKVERKQKEIKDIKKAGKVKLKQEAMRSTKPDAKIKVADTDSMGSILGARRARINRAKTPAEKDKIREDYKTVIRMHAKKHGVKFAKSTYHGSGAEFKKFDDKFVNSGEGMQAIGWGHYTTEVEDIGKFYADSIGKGKGRRNLYKLKLHKGKGEADYTYVDWNKPTPKNVADKIKTTLEEMEAKGQIFPALDTSTGLGAIFQKMASNAPFSEVYNTLRDLNTPEIGSAKDVSKFLLNKIGIDGLRAPTELLGGTAVGPKGKYNYVTFDADSITVEDHIRYAKGRLVSKTKQKAHEPVVKAIAKLQGIAENAVPSVIVENQKQLPSNMQMSLGEKDVISAAYDPKTKKIYFVADNIKDNKHAAKLWLHEHVGHKGLKDLFDKHNVHFNFFLDDAYKILKSDKAYANIKKLYAEETKDLDDTSRRRYLIEEVLAGRAEKLNTSKRKLIYQKFKDFVNKWLSRAFGLTEYQEIVTTEDIDAVLETAKNRVFFGQERAWMEFIKPKEHYKEIAKKVLKENPKALTWYDNHQAKLREVFGDDADLFNVLLAITSPEAKVHTNAAWAVQTYLYMHGKVSKPGGKYWNRVKRSVDSLMKGDFAGVEGKQVKLPEMIRALLGDQKATVNDRWMRQLLFGDYLLNPTLALSKASRDSRKSNFKVGENTSSRHLLTLLSKELTAETGYNWTPREVQAALWMDIVKRQGGEEYKEYTNITLLNDIDYGQALEMPIGTKLAGKTPLDWLNKKMGDTPIGQLHKSVKIPKMSETSKLEGQYQKALKEEGIEHPLKGGFAPVEADAFIKSRNKSKRLQYITPYEKDKLSKARLFMLPGHDVGYGIMPDGEIFNSFNSSSLRGAGALAKIDAVMKGGTWLNAYDGFLTKFNESLGFKVVNRKAWDPDKKPEGWVEEDGKPDYVTMEFKAEVYDPKILAGMYEAAWNKRLDSNPASTDILNSLSYQATKPTQAEAEKRTAEYLNKTSANYNEGSVNTEPETDINPFKNILATTSKAKSKKGRVALVQVTSNAARKEATNAGEDYFNKLYEKREGYFRPRDFWEIPQWMAEAAHTFPKADVYVVRNMEEARAFLSSAEYDSVMFSAMDANKDLIKRIVEGTDVKAIIGGYVPSDYYKDNKNVSYMASMQDAAKKLGVPYKHGTDYSLFKETETIPRLECSKGCKHNCAFCSVSKKITMPAKKDIEKQVKAFKGLGFKLVYLNDKTFGQAINYKNLVEFNKQMKEVNPDFDGFIIQTTAPALLRMSDKFLQDAGIKYVELGVETYNDNILKKIRKPHNTKLIDQAVDKLRANDIGFIPNIMVGLAGVKDGKLWTETKESYQNTLDFLKRNEDIISHTNPYVLAVYEGTELNEQLDKGIEADSDESVINKSWLKDKEIHENFYKSVLNFSSKLLDKGEAQESQVRFAKSWKDDITDPKKREVVDGIGYKHADPIKTFDKTHMTFWDRMIVRIADDKHALKILEKGKNINAAMSGYKAHKMLTSFPTMFRQFLDHGTPVYEDNWMGIKQDGGLYTAIRKLPEAEMEPFFHRFLAMSARELQGKDRKNLFGEELQDEATINILLETTDPAYEANKEVWDEVTKDLRRINKGFLDFIQEAGLIDEETRKGTDDKPGWEREFYIPFTRMITDFNTGEMETLYNQADGKDIKQVIRKLSGGKSRLGDPVLNLVNNYSFMMNEALTNLARKKSLSIMVDAGLAENVDNKAKGNNVLKIYVKGKVQQVRVDDPMLTDTLVDLHGASRGKTSQWFSWPKRALTHSVTFMAGFRFANFLRDTAHTALLEKSFLPVIDSAKGFKKAITNAPEMIEFAATGGAFSGSYGTRDIGKHGQKAVQKLAKDIYKRHKLHPISLLNAWEKFGEAAENAARLGLYMNLRKKGETKLEAGYRAKDLLDFYQSGKSSIIQAAIKTIPFLNARIQGTYKVGRTFADPKARRSLIFRGLLLAGLSSIVHAMYADDDRYKELQNHERLQYLNFFDVPGIGHLKIPLPFELGALFGTLPVFTGQWANGSIDEKRLYQVYKDTLIDTFRIDIFPQFLKPIVQQIANKNFFTGAPIETMSEQKREAAERFSVRTSDFSKAVGGILGKHIEQVSPKRIDAFVNDMFAGTGRMGLEIMDRVVMPWITSYPEDPATRIGDRYITGLGRFVKGTAAPYRTRSEEDFYELIKEADKANSTLNHYKKLGEMEKGRAYIEKKVDVLSKHKRLRRVQKKISKINQRIRLIGLSKTLSADQKRKEIDELLEMRNDIFHMVMTRVKEMEKE